MVLVAIKVQQHYLRKFGKLQIYELLVHTDNKVAESRAAESRVTESESGWDPELSKLMSILRKSGRIHAF